jgi:DNA mismatch repair protein MutS2
VSFHCDPATLERLEWPRLADWLARQAATARGAAACRADVFCATRASVAERLAETDEARGLVDAGADLSFGGVEDLRPLLETAQHGRALSSVELARVLGTAQGAARVRHALAQRAEAAPRLAALAGTLPDLGRLIDALGRVITRERDVRADATPELARLRRQIRQLEREIERVMARALRDPDVRLRLQDDYVTSREGRPVLPVQASARQRVRGIVHDVSSSGTTVFIEPEAAVDAGNRLRIARMELEREIERLLREATDVVRAHGDPLEGAGATLEVLDVALARGRLSRRLGGCAPQIDTVGIELRQLRHPLLLLEAGLEVDEVIANDIALPVQARCLIISGPNAGGKTVAAKAVGLAALALRAGLHVPCAPGSQLLVPDAVHADIGDEQDLRAGLSTFSARMRNAATLLHAADERSLVIVDEIGEGTEPGEGAALAQALLEALVERGAHVIATTHFNRLKELAGEDSRFANASAEFDLRTLEPTYRIHLGAPGSSGAMHAAQRMGLAANVVERARQLLDGEDRRLEALTRGLSELRQELEAERQSVRATRVQSEAARDRYEARLAGLRRSREAALSAMKSDLEDAFRAARAEVAAVVRTLQRGGRAQQGPEAGRAANRAQDRLRQIEARSRDVEARHTPPAVPGGAVSPERIIPGARIRLTGLPGEGVVLEPVDRRGQVAVRMGAARTRVGLERIERVIASAPPSLAAARVAFDIDRDTDAPPPLECDLRGLRVDEALDRAEAHLQSHLGRGAAQLRFVHGHGTGALRDAVRGWLRDIPQVAEVRSGEAGEGGNGVTVARIEGS